MELILILLAFVLLGLLGAVAGADSRDGRDWRPGAWPAHSESSRCRPLTGA
jgi:hypothetical protein